MVGDNFYNYTYQKDEVLDNLAGKDDVEDMEVDDEVDALDP